MKTLSAVLVSAIVLFSAGGAAAAAPEQLNALVTAVGEGKVTVTVEHREINPFPQKLAPDAVVDDVVHLYVQGKDVTAAKVVAHVTNWGRRAGTFAAALLFVFGLMALVTWGKPRDFFVGSDGRYSNSKTQMASWFMVVIAAYLASIAMRLDVGGGALLGGVSIPTNLLVLSGLSALTFGGAKVITSQKVDQAVGQGKASPKTPGEPNILTDLFVNDSGDADLGDFQMILITFIAIVIFACATINFLAYVEYKTPVTLPEIDTTLLSMFGIGQGAYLIKKMASAPGQG